MSGYADIRHARADAGWWVRHGVFFVVATVAVVLARLGRMTRWALREGWYRPHVALAVVVSTLAAFWGGPLSGPIVFVTLATGRLIWMVDRFGRACGAPRRFLRPTLIPLSRAVWRTWRLRRRWPLAVQFLKLGHGLTGEPPRTRHWEYHSPVRASCVVNLSNAPRHIVDDVTRGTSLLAQTLKLHSVMVEPVRGRPGLARFTCYWGSRLEEVIPITALPEPMPGWAWFGLGEDEEPAGLKLEFSALFVGESRSGKSTAMWASVLSSLEQWQRGGEPVQFWVIDLALTEFAAAKPLTRDDRTEFASEAFEGYRYATTQPQANALLRLLEEESKRRARLMMESDGRKLRPTEDMPRIVLVVDELLRLIEKKGGRNAQALGSEAEGRMRMLLTQYAKFGIVAWAGTQASKVEVMTSIRDWFQQRVAFSTSTTQMTDCALGEGASASGAASHTLSVHRDGGRAWMKRDGFSGYYPVRGVWVDDDATRVIGQGRVPDPLLAARGQPTSRMKTPGAVYIMWGPPDEGGQMECLYVGVTTEQDPSARWVRHLGGARRKEWVRPGIEVEVIAEDETSGRPLSKRDAALLERRKIRELHPRYNDVRYVTVTDYEMELELEGADR